MTGLRRTSGEPTVTARDTLAEALWTANNFDPLAQHAEIKSAEVQEFADAILAADPTLAADLELGQAWRLAEEALPYKRGGIELTMLNRNDGPDAVATADSWAIGGPTVHVEATGPTPAAALSNLRAALKERKGL